MQINFKKIALASAFISVLSPLLCAPSARASQLFNYTQQQEQKRNLSASVFAAAKNFTASKTRFQLAGGIIFLTGGIITFYTLGLIMAGDYYRQSNPALSEKFYNIANAPFIFLYKLITSPIDLYRIMRYGKIGETKTITIPASYTDFNQKNDTHNFVDENVKTKISELTKKFTEFTFSTKTNKWGKESYCFIRKDSLVKSKSPDKNQEKENRTQRLFYVREKYNKKNETTITPNDTIQALYTLLQDPKIHTIIVNKTGLSYAKTLPQEITVSKTSNLAADSVSLFGLKTTYNYYPIKIKWVDSSPEAMQSPKPVE